MQTESHFCYPCGTTFPIRPPIGYTGDALIICPNCGLNHNTQLDAGLVVSNRKVSEKHIYITVFDPEEIR